ncbi:MAG: hypothetical protein AB1352_00415 [Patescibacteria group bacterium]
MSRHQVVHVIPSMRLSWNAPAFFSYLIPPSLPPPLVGSWVSIPFRHITRQGLVTALAETREIKKPLRSLYALLPFIPLGASFIRFITAAAQETLNHPSRFLTYARLRISEPFIAPVRSRETHERGDTKKPVLVWWNEASIRRTTLIERAHAFVDDQHLILVPTREQVSEIIALLRQNQMEAFGLTSQTPQKDLAFLLRRILSGDPCIAVGTRSALFLPFTRLGAITIDHEEHPAFTQTSPPPRYHLHRVSTIMQSIYHADLMYVSACPSLTAFGGSHIRTRPNLAKETRVEIIDCSSTHLTQTPFHPSVFERIQDTIKGQKNALVVSAQSGYAPLLQCRDCLYTFTCPTCEVLLGRETAQSSELLCNRCGYREAIPPLCPRCNGVRLRYAGFGPARLIEYLSSHGIPSCPFPLLSHKFGCGVGRIHELVTIPRVPIGILVAINVDMLLARPWFTSSERALQELVRLRVMSEQWNAHFCIQTLVPTHPVLTALKGDAVPFYTAEIALRKKLGYPPFSRILQVIIPLINHKDEMQQMLRINTLRKKLQMHSVQSTPPAIRYRRRVKSIAFSIRSNGRRGKEYVRELLRILPREFPSRAIIDVDSDAL